MKNIFLGSMLIFLMVNAQAQNPQDLDSLKKAAALTNDAKTYNQIARTFLQHQKLDSAIFYFQKALANTDDRALENQIRKGYGLAYLNLGFFALAQEQFFKALKTAVELKDSTQMALAYLNLGMVARGANLYDKAVQYYEEGLKLNSSAGVKNLIRNELGQALTQKKDYYKALTVFQEIFPQLKQQPQSSVYNSVGNTFIELKSYDSAYKYAALALSLDETSRDSAGLMWNWQLMGKYYYGVNQFGKAKSLSHAALRLNEKYGTESFDWYAVELPKLYQLMSNIYSAERKTDSLLWLKEQEAMFYKRLWEEQKKHAAEFVFNSQEDEVKALVQKEKQTRKGLTQYYGIALVLLMCTLAYFIWSGRDSKRRYTPYISIVVLVFLFEFLLVVLDPSIGKITNDEPLYKFMINAVLALALVPVHFFGERFLKTFAIDIRIKKVG